MPTLCDDTALVFVYYIRNIANQRVQEPSRGCARYSQKINTQVGNQVKNHVFCTEFYRLSKNGSNIFVLIRPQWGFPRQKYRFSCVPFFVRQKVTPSSLLDTHAWNVEQDVFLSKNLVSAIQT